MCCQRLERVETLAAEFWTYWSLSRALLGTGLQVGSDVCVNELSESDGRSLDNEKAHLAERLNSDSFLWRFDISFHS